MSVDGQAGDTTFDGIYVEHYVRILRTVRAIVGDADAEDVTQDAFVNAYRRFHRYDPSRPVGAWLHRIAVNGAISHLRRRRLAALFALRRPAEEAIDPADASLSRILVRRALERLAPDQRAAVVLRYYHDYSYRDIAYVLGVPEGTVGSRLTLAVRRLRRVLGEESGDPARSAGKEDV